MNKYTEQEFSPCRQINRFSTWAYPNRHLRINPHSSYFPQYCKPPCYYPFTTYTIPQYSPYSGYANYSPYSSF